MTLDERNKELHSLIENQRDKFKDLIKVMESEYSDLVNESHISSALKQIDKSLNLLRNSDTTNHWKHYISQYQEIKLDVSDFQSFKKSLYDFLITINPSDYRPKEGCDCPNGRSLYDFSIIINSDNYLPPPVRCDCPKGKWIVYLPFEFNSAISIETIFPYGRPELYMSLVEEATKGRQGYDKKGDLRFPFMSSLEVKDGKLLDNYIASKDIYTRITDSPFPDWTEKYFLNWLKEKKIKNWGA